MTQANDALSVRGLTKCFGALRAVDGASFKIAAGEIHCLLGENGSGKSTVSSCIYGLLEADEGDVFLGEKRITPRSPADAIRAGIGMVHQHFVLVPGFTVAENITVGTGRPWRVDAAAARARIGALSARFGFEIDAGARAGDLAVGTGQWVEILKALHLGARYLILDEPTAVLTPQESDRLFRILRELTRDGVGVLLITHKMHEVMQSDRVTILRRGKVVTTVATPDVTRDALTEMMIGRALRPAPSEARHRLSTTALALEEVRLGHNSAEPISLSVAEGEILGIAGISGNGQDTLLEAIAGLAPPLAGRILLGSRDVTRLGAAAVAAAGVGHIPADRLRDGLVPDFTVAENIILGAHWSGRWRRGPFLRRGAMAQAGRAAVAGYAIAGAGPDLGCGRLSGGNAQKVIVAREIAKATRLLLCNQPTRGVDVSAIEFIHARIVASRDAGCAVLLVSEDIDQLFELSDRVAVMFRGAVVGILDRSGFDKLAVGSMMSGQRAA